MVDLGEAILLDREALKLRPNPHPDRSRSLHNLAVSLGELYEHTNAMADLEEAISLYREALERRPPPHPDRLTTLDRLSASLVNRYRHTRTRLTSTKLFPWIVNHSASDHPLIQVA